MGYLNGYLFSWQGWNAIAASCLMMLGIGLFICRFIFAKYEKQPQIKTVSSGEFLIIDTKCVFILSIMESSFFH
ncbi:permease [Salmonella enterica subsp. enterica serovar Heidelberg str. 77-1831]|nr:permease [Salmonella enterica subsp. enterica serovar Heidelberg str. 77-1831]